jgi:glycosyltransferase involved in cell wall biosynthesis
MHILLLPSWYKTDKEPFMGTFFEEQARGLMKAGHRVGIIYPEFVPFRSLFSDSATSLKMYEDQGLPTYHVPVQSMLPNIRRTGYRSFIRTVEKVFRGYITHFGMPDIIHAHSVFYGGIAGASIAASYKLPFVITEHLTAFIMGTITHKTDLQLARKIFTDAQASLIVSNTFKKDLSRILQVDDDVFRVVHNMVNELFFENRIIKKIHPDEPFTLFTNSFLLPRKNHKLIFQAIGQLVSKGLNVKLLVGGDGELAGPLRNLADELELSHHIEFLGGLNRQQVKENIDRSHAFLLASFYETFGVVLIESLAAGRPVITTNSGGPEDIVTPENGIILKDFNAQTMAAGIEKLMNQYPQYNQDKISEDCYSRFSEKKIISNLEEVYRQALNARKAIST